MRAHAHTHTHTHTHTYTHTPHHHPTVMSTLRMFVELEPSESEAGADSGGKGDDSGNLISLWNLYRYVHHNPELEALAKSHR